MQCNRSLFLLALSPLASVARFRSTSGVAMFYRRRSGCFFTALCGKFVGGAGTPP